MTTPSVDVSILQNSLGIQPPTDGDILAIVGPADGGAFDTPGLYGRTKGVQTDFIGGPLVEAGALAIEVASRPVVLVRTQTTTAGAIGSITLDMDGTAVPVAAQGSTPTSPTSGHSMGDGRCPQSPPSGRVSPSPSRTAR